MADCEVEGTIASPLSIPLERAMSPTGERRDEARNIRTRQNPFGPQERQTRISKAGNKCQYRHCTAAKARDIVCPLWPKGMCANPSCPLGIGILNCRKILPVFMKIDQGGAEDLIVIFCTEK
ncbi:hypothetical protein TNCV_2576701 [Trichonephila clavipes]|nr:hypothetical protein TNCV_2576701 [Trichonephila clavipes]